MGRLSEEEAGGKGRNTGGRVGAPTCRGSPEGLGGSLLSLCHLYLYGHAPRLSPAPCPSVPCRRNQCCLNRPLLPKRPLRGPSVHVVPRHAFPVPISPACTVTGHSPGPAGYRRSPQRAGTAACLTPCLPGPNTLQERNISQASKGLLGPVLLSDRVSVGPSVLIS